MSYDKAKFWLREISMNADSGTKVILVANKVDLGFEVSQETLAQFSKLNGMELCLVSAKTGEGIDELLELIYRLASNADVKSASGNQQIQNFEPEKKEKGCCE